MIPGDNHFIFVSTAGIIPSIRQLFTRKNQAREAAFVSVKHASLLRHKIN